MVRLRFLEVPARRLCRVLRCFCRISRYKVVQEEKSDKLTNFRSVEAAHSYVEHAAVVFLGPGGLVVKQKRFPAVHDYVDVFVADCGIILDK